MAILILALLELDVNKNSEFCFCAKKTRARNPSLTCSYGSTPSVVLGRIGRLVGDQERNKSSYSHTKFDINQGKEADVEQVPTYHATGGTVAQDLTVPWSTLSGFMQDLSLMVIDEGQQYGTDREIRLQPSACSSSNPYSLDRGRAANTGRNCSNGP